MVNECSFQIEIGSGSVTAIETPKEGTSEGWTFIYAPGAGSNVNDLFGTFACRELAKLGARCVRIQFPYQEANRRGPDRPTVLEATWRAAIDAVRDGNRLVVRRKVDGRANRLASCCAGRQGRCAATFFCSGADDTFASPEELTAAASMIERSRLHLLGVGVDHGFTVRPAAGKTRELVRREAVEAMWAWLISLWGTR